MSDQTPTNLPPIQYNRKKSKTRKLFSKDIENLLYSMGDQPYSLDSTISTLEDLLIEFITQLSTKMVNYASSQGRNRIKLNDLAFVLRNDPLKLSRMLYILEQQQRIEKAKKLFEEDNNTTNNINDDGIDNDNDESNDDENDRENDNSNENDEDNNEKDNTNPSGRKKYKKRAVEYDENGNVIKKKYKKREKKVKE
ncbi:uncharacterized protein KGF55_005150 [Candida pseudojiufengensis]|uniref:uncharacterized protein n=1 Tax=Candida pseudojiufengensis TaxID=497109 RepID=UPI002225B5DE|nr:uncharacterized protein KGF55_005150 [Candida pseudojiufengensis]KAI5959918.1 hypothetical protein KGF55_005150 [Candida pseudojiufengensis]